MENQLRPSKIKESFEKQWPAAKTYDSLWKPILLLKRLSNCKEKTPTALSYKMLEAKKTNTFIEKAFLTTQKLIVFIEKRSWMTKNLEHRGKAITAIQNERILWKAMTCCKKVWLSLKTTSAFKKPSNSKKKLPQHCLTKCLKPKRPTFSLKHLF